MMLEVFSNLNDSVIPVQSCPCQVGQPGCPRAVEAGGSGNICSSQFPWRTPCRLGHAAPVDTHASTHSSTSEGSFSKGTRNEIPRVNIKTEKPVLTDQAKQHKLNNDNNNNKTPLLPNISFQLPALTSSPVPPRQAGTRALPAVRQTQPRRLPSRRHPKHNDRYGIPLPAAVTLDMPMSIRNIHQLLAASAVPLDGRPGFLPPFLPQRTPSKAAAPSLLGVEKSAVRFEAYLGGMQISGNHFYRACLWIISHALNTRVPPPQRQGVTNSSVIAPRRTRALKSLVAQRRVAGGGYFWWSDVCVGKSNFLSFLLSILLTALMTCTGF